MLFRESPSPPLAISQPAHAWISGQLMRAWAEPLPEAVLLAAEQHDIGWLDWEAAPTFDPATGRPHLFRHVGVERHAPMWARGVDRALGAWGSRVALLISRHGSVIYTKFTDRGGMTDADRAAAEHYVQTQGVLQASWARALGLDEATLVHDTALVALSDTISLALCGELATPLSFDAPGRADSMRGMRLLSTGVGEFTLAPWPFRGEVLVVEAEGRVLPASGRFADEAAMRAWHISAERVVVRARLVPG